MKVSPAERIFAEILVDEIGVAGREVRAEHRALAEAELLDEQGETDGDLFAAGPRGDMNRVARKFGNPVRSVLRQGCRGKGSDKQRRQRSDQARPASLWCHWRPRSRTECLPARSSAAFESAR